MKEQQSSKTFSQWMDQFSSEQDAINVEDAKRLRRQEILGKVRLILSSVTGVALVVAGIVYRVEIGQEIPPDHYRSIAAAIRFADRIRKKAGARR